ncbi:peptidase [Bordetella sp. N]|nr:peptidase [Bordetella sp. N]
MAGGHPDIAEVARVTQHWLTRAVIGLNLCPFAKRVHVKRQIRYVVSAAVDEADIAAELESELQLLADTDAQDIDTTMLILPDAFADFYEFNDFLDIGDRLLKRLRLRGVLQVASFHPDYQFAETQPDDIENYTNRSPFPILHLLREDSIEEVLETYPDPDDIYEKNQETMRRLGLEGWRKLMREAG